MKIIELRFKNLNSLYGEWLIDFSNPEYLSNGIFALTGPTGAGKSTILDAICLALYGATPRLGKITKSENEIMSQNTGECYAEVVFESQTGCFRCHWEQRRARKQAEGQLQEQEHQIADAETGRLIESKKSLVLDIIEEKTGMDFNRFTRSIMLAQGSFDTFLKAEAEQKSRILEQITGTDIYSNISKSVHERQREERESLNLLKAETSGISVIDENHEQEIKIQLESNQKKAIELDINVSKTEKEIRWLNTIEELENELLSLEDEAEKLKGDIKAFEPDKNRLSQALKAAELDGFYTKLISIREQQNSDTESLKREEAELSEIADLSKKQKEVLKSAESISVNTKENLDNETSLIKKVRQIDQIMTEKQNAISDLDSLCSKKTFKIESEKENIGNIQNKKTKLLTDLKKTELYLSDNRKDELLIGGLAVIEEQLSGFAEKQREAAHKEDDIKRAEEYLTEVSANLALAQKESLQQKAKLEEVRKELENIRKSQIKLLDGRLLREYRSEKEGLIREKSLIKTIESLEKHRALLENGKACPLCGSTEHPYADHNIPEADEIDLKIETLTGLINDIESCEDKIKDLEKKETAVISNLNDSEKSENNAANEKTSAEKNLHKLRDELAQQKEGLEQLSLALSEKLEPLGIEKSSLSESASLVNSLKQRLSEWNKNIKEKESIEKNISEFDTQIKALKAVVGTEQDNLAEQQEKLESIKADYKTRKEEREKLYGLKNPDAEEKRLTDAVSEALRNEESERKKNSDIENKKIAVRANIESIKLRIQNRSIELKQKESEFLIKLDSLDFSDEHMFISAILTKDKREQLSQREKELDKNETDISARNKDRKNRLENEKSKNITDKNLDELKYQFQNDNDLLKQLRELIAADKHRLEENISAKERIKEKEAEISARTEECQRWEKLHSLIGSADGKKYRNFAQGLTFELMVSHANRNLKKMTDRYILIRDQGYPLELNVIDNYQAGETRSVKNLSGGESFIVSLSLALGLSKMASKKVRVDSLFLDEGFGTLDEESLETSLETLSNLQHDGKLIGVISHVPALKERISTQINISSVSGGKSIIQGPGCKKLV